MDPLPHSRRRSPAGVSVAELVSLHSLRTPADPVAADPAAPPVSVAALLRREGRGPHAADRPLRPRAHSRPEPVEVPLPRRGVRKVTVAAGALFAVSAVFGASVLDESLSRPDRESGDAFAVPEPDAGRAGAVPADRGVGLATALAALPEDGGAPDVRPIASGADIGNDALAGLVGTVPGEGSPAAGDPAAGDPAVGDPAAGDPAVGDPAAGVPGGSAPVGGAPGDGGPAAPGVDQPAPGSPGVEDPGGAPGPTVPGPVAPGPVVPGQVVPGQVVPGQVVPGQVVPGQVVTVPLPDLATPGVTLPPAGAPAVTVGEAAIDAPDLTLGAGDDGLTLSASRAAVTTPDLAADGVDAGPVVLTDTAAELPDVEVEGTGPLLVVGAEPEVTVPAITVSEAELRTPDVTLGEVDVELPDLRTPELAVPEVPVVQTLTGVLGI